MEYSYNFLNLPCSVYDNGDMVLHYTYFADGTKYSAMHDFNEGYLYVGPFVYKIHPDYDYPFLESVSSEEGRLVCDESSHIWRDCWFTKDHIGNVRTVLDLSKSASAPLSDIIVEQDSYLPFGTKSANPALFGSNNRYRLCGNEEQHLFDFTTTLTDFGARSYNPTICRWMTIDPLAEKYYSLAPYVYCHNTPIVFIDPNGCADINWKLVLSGTGQLASGSAMAITGASICVGTDGIAAPLGGAAMITAGLGTTSIGLANITAGIKGVENLPLPDTMTGTVGMAIDETINSIEGTDNHIFENVGNAAEFTVGLIPPFTTSLSKAMKGIQTFTSTCGNIGTVTETGINVYYKTQEYYTKYIFHDDNIDEQDDSKTN